MTALSRAWSSVTQSRPETMRCRRELWTRWKKHYQSTSLKQLLEFSKAQFRYWTEDAFASRFRRLLTLEQYRSETMGKLYQQYLAAGPMGYVADLFAGMGFSEPQEKAASFYAPMFLFIHGLRRSRSVGERSSACAGGCLPGTEL